jgi:hypothetical protein
MTKFKYKGSVTVFYYGGEISLPTTDGAEFGDENLAWVIEDYCKRYKTIKFYIEGIEERK